MTIEELASAILIQTKSGRVATYAEAGEVDLMAWCYPELFLHLRVDAGRQATVELQGLLGPQESRVVAVEPGGDRPLGTYERRHEAVVHALRYVLDE